MSNRTIVAILAVLGLLAVVVAVQPVFAWEAGCTPGYWRQEHHFDSWPEGIAPGDTIYAVCNDPDLVLVCGYGFTYIDPEITLIDALWAKGGGENAFLRHGAAALLSSLHPEVAEPPTCHVCGNLNDPYGPDPVHDFEGHKNWFEGYNEIGCPLD
jgi:hypothetical protein